MVRKKDLGMVLFADDRPREEIVVKQADSRKIIFLNCYPYDDNSKVVVFDRLRIGIPNLVITKLFFGTNAFIRSL